MKKNRCFLATASMVVMLVLLSGLFSDTMGQTTISLGTGTAVNTTTSAGPINEYYRSLHGQVVYTAAEMVAAGATAGYITSLGWYVTLGVTNPLPNYTIKMKLTTATNVATNDGVGLTTVHVIPSYSPIAGGWDMLVLTTPFFWDGTSNLLVDMCFDQVSAYTSTGQARIYTTTNGFRYVRSDSAPQCGVATATITTDKPQVRMIINPPMPDDAGVRLITSPVSPATIGSNPVNVILKNFGSNTLTSANIDWTVDGVAQPGFSWTGSQAPQTETSVGIGNATLAAGFHTIKAWSTLPNGATDSYAPNDTSQTSVNACNTFSGTYTIGATGSDYPTFQSAVAAMISCGVTGPTVFNVAPGTYNESFNITAIPGTSATNTVTFQSATGDSTSVIITTVLPGSNSAIIRMNGCSYVTIKKMTLLAAAGSTACKIIDFTGAAHHNSWLNNRVIGIPTSTAGTPLSYALVYSDNFNDNYNTFDRNLFQGGSYGMYWYGTTTSPYEQGTVITNNTFLNQYYMGIYGYYQNAPVYVGNTIVSNSTYATMYGIYAYYNYNNVSIQRNTIQLPLGGYGVYTYYCTGTSSLRGLTANNMISCSPTGTNYAIYCNNTTYHDFLHNSVNISGSSTSSRAFYYTGSSGANLTVKNNILCNQAGGYAIYFGSTTGWVGANCNFNDLYTNGTNLGYYAANKTTLALWQASLAGLDANSISVNPQYLSNTNLHTVFTGVNNLGTPLAAVTVDIDNQIRSTTTPDMGADEFTPPNNDAGVLASINPISPTNIGTSDVVVTIRNYGLLPLTSVTIAWMIDGVAQPSFDWTGTIPPLTTSGNITLGSYPFVFGNHVFKSWTSLPNGVMDEYPTNDTLLLPFVVCNGMAGNYTIGGTGSDFATFAEAVNLLNTCGVDGPVVFNVAPGTYTEQIKLTTITGASAVNTITFQSATLDSSSVILQFTPTSATTNYTVWLNGADWITFSKMTIKSFGNTALANVVVINGNSCNNTFYHNRLTGVTPVAVADNYDMSVIYATKGSASVDSSNVYDGNRIEFGYCGIYDNNTSGAEPGLQVINNYFYNQSRLATNLRYQSHPIVSGNTINTTMPSMYSANDMFGIHMVNATNGFDIQRNNIYLSNAGSLNYGTAINSCTATSTSRGVFANNMVVINSQTNTNANYGIHVGGGATYPNSYFDVYHNSVNIFGGTNASSRALSLISGGTATDVNILNNIFANQSGGFAMYLDYTAGFISNYNNLYSTGANLVYRGANFANLATWQAASGTPDLNSLSVDPIFFSNTDLHTLNFDLNNVGTPVLSVVVDIDGQPRSVTNPDMGADEFTPASFNTQLLAILSPGNGCGLSSSSEVTIRIKNVGSNIIVPGQMTATFVLGTNTPVTEPVMANILPGSFFDFTFTTTVDLNAPSVPLFFDLATWISLPGDPQPGNDSLDISFVSDYQPLPPLSADVTIGYAQNATLVASSILPSDYLMWFSDAAGSNMLVANDSLIVGPLYDTTTYYVQSVAPGGMTTWTFDNSLQGWTPTAPCAAYSGYNFSWNSDGGQGTAFASDPAVTSAQLLVSPVVNVVGNSSVNLSFIHRYVTESCCDEGTVFYRLDNGPWVQFVPTTSGYNGSHSIDSNPVNGCTSNTLNSYFGTSSYITSSGTIVTTGASTIQIAFVFTSDPSVAGTGWYINEVNLGTQVGGCGSELVPVTAIVQNIPANDAGIVAISSPVSGIELCMEDVTVTIQNWGFSPITNFQINYEVIETGTMVSEILQDTVFSGGTLVHTFSTPADLCDLGTYTILAYTSILGDTYNVNDTSTISVTNSPLVYCISTATSTIDEDISNVTFAGINNNSAALSALYTNYANLTPGQVYIGGIYPISITEVDAEGSSFYSGYVEAYLDWNHNGVFEEPAEVIFGASYPATQTNVLTGTVQVPITAVPGTHRLRIVCREGGSAAVNVPCGTYTYGETEDYLVTVIPPFPWDAGITQISTPSTTLVEGNSTPVVVTLANYGTNPITSVPIYYTVNGGTPVFYEWTGSLAFSQTTTVTLPTLTVPGGAYTLCAYTVLPSDGNPANNQTCVNLFATPQFDAKMVSIVSPASGCDLNFAPVIVKIKNLGDTISGGLAAGYTLNGALPGVLEQITSTIMPGDTLTYTFTALANLQVPVETAFEVKAFVQLVADPVQTNDTATIDIISGVTPPLPIVPTQTVFTGAPATLTPSNALSGANYLWYTVDTTYIASGDTLITSPIMDTTVFLVRGGSSGASIAITEINIGSTDYIEIQNLSGASIDATGWKVVVSDSYSSINAVNANAWNLGVMPPGQVLYKSDNSTNNYWGSNLFWNPGAYPSFTGWAMIVDNLGSIVDFVSWGWPATNIQSMAITVSGFPITVGDEWVGNGIVNPSMDFLVRNIYDNNTLSDWTNAASGNIGTANPNLVVSGGVGAGCQSGYGVAIVNNIDPDWDADVIAIPAPVSGVEMPNSSIVVIQIENNGLNAISNLPVSYTLNGGSPVNEVVTATIPSGATYSYTFTTPVNLGTFGTYTLTACASLAGDQLPFNDCHTSIVVNSPINFCISAATSTIDEDIQVVNFAGINNTSAVMGLVYTDYTTTVAPGLLIQGQTYSITITENDAEGTYFYSGYIEAYIDYNHNGVFEEPSEVIFGGDYGSVNALNIVTGTVTVPMTSSIGVQRLRIVCREGGSEAINTPCGTYSYGETEDYLVQILPASPLYPTGVVTNNVCYQGTTGSIDVSVINNGAILPYSYLWSNGATTEDVSGLAAGSYCVTVIDSATPPNVNSTCFTVTEASQILTSVFGTNATAYGALDGVVDLWVFNGTVPYTFQWFNGTTTEDLSGVSAGNYVVTITDAAGCQVSTGIYLTSPLPGSGIWNEPVQTGVIHQISMAANASVTIDGANLAPGALVGVFYDSLTVLKCAGYMFWNGAPYTFNAYGNNPLTPGPDGFATGETFKWKVLQYPAGLLGSGNPVYDLTYPQTSLFTANGHSGVTSLPAQTVVTQAIPLPMGWSMWSTYIIPPEMAINTVIQKGLGLWSASLTNAQMNDLVELQINIVKNYLGQVYWPSVGTGLNSIGNLNNAQGYAIKTLGACTLNITGQQIQPQTYNLSMPQGWSMISYLRSSPGTTSTMMSTGVSNINNAYSAYGTIVPWIDIMKNYTGQVYWPSINLNSIGTMKPGQGYQIKTRAVNFVNATYPSTYTITFPLTYKYPANTEAPAKDEATSLTPTHFAFGLNTGHNMTLGIPLSAWDVVPAYGDELAVVSAGGQILGAGVFEGGTMAVAIWGDDETTLEKEAVVAGEPITLVLWNSLTGREQRLTVLEWEQGDGTYSKDGISLVKKMAPMPELVYALNQNRPNPFNGTTAIGFSIPEDGFVTISVYNLLGEKITELVNADYKAGTYSVDFAARNLPAGSYYYRMVSNQFTATRQMTLNP